MSSRDRALQALVSIVLLASVLAFPLATEASDHDQGTCIETFEGEARWVLKESNPWAGVSIGCTYDVHASYSQEPRSGTYSVHWQTQDGCFEERLKDPEQPHPGYAMVGHILVDGRLEADGQTLLELAFQRYEALSYPCDPETPATQQGLCPPKMARGSADWSLDEGDSYAYASPDGGGMATARCVYLHPPVEGRGQPGVRDVRFDVRWHEGPGTSQLPAACGGDSEGDVLGHPNRQAETRWAWTMNAVGQPDQSLLDAFEAHARELLAAASDRAAACPEAGPVTFRGTVLVGAGNLIWPVPSAAVDLVLHEETFGSVVGEITTLATDAEGRFEVVLDVAEEVVSWSVQVHLAHQDGRFEVQDGLGSCIDVEPEGGGPPMTACSFSRRGPFQDEAIRVVRAEQPLPGGAGERVADASVLIAEPYEGLDAMVIEADGSITPLEPLSLAGYDPAVDMIIQEEGAYPPSRYRDAAMTYVFTHDAVEFADRLSADPAGLPPFTVKAMVSDAHSSYTPGRSLINIQADLTRHIHDPGNVEFHELGHHLHWASPLGGTRSIPAHPPDSRSHAGVENPDSTDSLTEGFAVFFAALAAGDRVYQLGGASIDLELNEHYRAGGRLLTPSGDADLPADAQPHEEMLVASLLFDLLDDTAEPGDAIDLIEHGGSQAVFSEDVFNVRTLYEAVSVTASSAPYSQADVDALFALHLFYADTDGDGRWTPGVDEAGWADRFHPEDGRRANLPALEGTLILPGITDDTGAAVTPEAYRVSVVFDQPYYDRTYTAFPIDERGALRIHVPATANNVTVTPLIPGFTAEPMVLTPEMYFRGVAEAAATNRSVWHEPEVVAQPAAISPPTRFSAARNPDGTVQLTWTPDPDAAATLIVRGAHAPETPGQGEVVFQGPETSFMDEGGPEGWSRYAAFSLSQAGGVSEPAQADPDPEFGEGASADTDGPSAVWLLIGAGSILLAYWIYSGRQRQGPPPGPPPHAPPPHTQGPMDARPPDPPGPPPGPPPPG